MTFWEYVHDVNTCSSSLLALCPHALGGWGENRPAQTQVQHMHTQTGPTHQEPGQQGYRPDYCENIKSVLNLMKLLVPSNLLLELNIL